MLHLCVLCGWFRVDGLEEGVFVVGLLSHMFVVRQAVPPMETFCFFACTERLFSWGVSVELGEGGYGNKSKK